MDCPPEFWCISKIAVADFVGLITIVGLIIFLIVLAIIFASIGTDK